MSTADELSRNRTYIINLEGLCPNPLNDELYFWTILGSNQ